MVQSILVIVITALVISMPQDPNAPPSKSLLPFHLGLIGANALDLASTKQALDTGRFAEANPLLGSSFPRIAATKALVSAPIGIAAQMLNKNHPKLARGMELMGMAIPSLAALHNYRLMAQSNGK